MKSLYPKVFVKANQFKMSPEELEAHLKNRRGCGGHKSPKDYNRKALKKVAY